MPDAKRHEQMATVIQTSDKDYIIISYKDFLTIEDNDAGKRLAELIPNVFVNDKRDLLVSDLKPEVDRVRTPSSLRIIDALIRAKENLKTGKRS